MTRAPGGPGRRSADEALASGVVRISGEDGGEPVGAGCLIARDLVLTCAHVVSDALDRPREAAVTEGTAVRAGFPLLETPAGRIAEVVHWVGIDGHGRGDVAVLRLREPAPEGARPLSFSAHREVWDHRTRAVGFTGGEPGERWFRGRLGGPTGEGWLQLSRADGQTTHIEEGFSGSPVWDDEMGAVVGLVVATHRGRDAQAFVLHTRTVLRALPPELAAVLDPPSPFRGLAAYQEDDEDVFFGRQGDVEDVLAALRGGHRAVTLYGPSGCGKSSVARAGVVPRMRRAGYEVLVVDAGKVSSPRAALAVELYEAVRQERYGPPRAGGVDEVEGWLAAYGLADTLHRVRGDQDGRLLVVLDQAEALLDRTDAELGQAVDLLFPERAAGGARVLLTLRADFMDAVLKHPRLGPALRSGRTLPLTPMSPEQLREVVVRPVERLPAVEYDPGLAERILTDAGGDPGALPLLGFVLETLWARRSCGRLSAAAYEETGGVSGALKQHAAAAWKACAGSPGASQEALRLLTGLVRVLPGSETPLRRRLTREEAGEDRWRIARALAEQRLLVLHGDQGEPETAELAHEALFTAWPELKHQVEVDARFLAARAELAHDLDRWERGGRVSDLLPGPLHLGALEGRLDGREHELAAGERYFLDLARSRRRARRVRTRAAWTAVAAVFALLVGLGTFLVHQAEVSAARDAEARSRALATASDELAARDPGLASLAAVAAYDTAPTHEARNALLRRYASFKTAAWVLSGAEGEIRGVASDTGGAVVLASTERGRATLFVRRDGGQVTRRHLRPQANAVVPLVSRDGRRVAYLSAGSGDLTWHDVDPAADDPLGPAHTVRAGGFRNAERAPLTGGVPADLAGFSPDGDAVASVSRDGRVWLWDLRTGRNRVLAVPARGAEGVAYGPDGDTLVVHLDEERGPLRGTLAVVDTTTGTARNVSRGVGLIGEFTASTLSGDGRVLVFCERPEDGGRARYRAVRVDDGHELVRHTPESHSNCADVAVDRAGSRFAVHHGDGRWTFVGTGPDGAVRQTSGIRSGLVKGLPLLTVAGTSAPLVWDGGSVTALPMHTDSFDIVSPPVLLAGGTRMLVHKGDRGERLALLDIAGAATGGRVKVVEEAPRTPSPSALTTPLEAVSVNASETLAADLVRPDLIEVRSLPSLRALARIPLAVPPQDTAGKRLPPYIGFTDDDVLLTVSGSAIEQWDPRSGRRTAAAIDARDLGLTGREPAEFFVRPHAVPGHLLVSVSGEPVVHAVDRRTGRVDERLRVRFGDDYLFGSFTKDGRYAVTVAAGGMLEGWRLTGDGKAARVVGPLTPPMEITRSRLRAVGDSAYVVANGPYVRFLHLAEPYRTDTYDLGTDQVFHAVSADGLTVLRQDGGGMDVLRLDPALWKRHLCAVVGRDTTEQERRGLPPGLPDRICPGRR
ncbi:hypothetical protein BJP40_16995 [Streptomyces sp. CC53]|uniref:nSTAND1 domain-containing NTPase n=1 Tax=unclassified Streptomyces TaxID=2593676 RepID=UPI0008DE0816|nr:MULTISPECIES: trypsin-like peptidase domain-containing protein [unclassified Streptomyces]OII65413.1 hypothetical protein BJP40_16995 [Streptomyces sp. CC53]